MSVSTKAASSPPPSTRTPIRCFCSTRARRRIRTCSTSWQVMDHGKLTDHNGKRVDFQNVILIMTTNAGATDLAKAAIGFNRSNRLGDDEEAINRLLSLIHISEPTRLRRISYA